MGDLSHWLPCPFDMLQSPLNPKILAFDINFGILPHLSTEIALRSFRLQWFLDCQAKLYLSILNLPELTVTILLISFLQIPFHFLKIYYGIFKQKATEKSIMNFHVSITLLKQLSAFCPLCSLSHALPLGHIL